jgi:Holliday junction DNA helicase RuvA
MYEFIRGKMVQSTPSKAIVDVGGVGYGLVISIKTFQKLPNIGTEVFFYALHIVREDGHYLYGFLTLDDKKLFEQLISINGIGPKTAIGILGHVDIGDFQMAVVQGNAALLAKVPGIGKKTSERIIIELKDKFTNSSSSGVSLPSGAQGNSVVADAISALINLGYHPLEAQKAIKKVLSLHEKEPTVSELISGALRSI